MPLTPTSDKINRLARSFELVAELRAAAHSKRGLLSKLVRLLAGSIEYQFLPYYFGGVPRWRLWLRRWFSGRRALPDFVVIGPIKSGSSDLTLHLLAHPNIIAPLAKEIFSPEPEDWRPYYPTEREMQRANRRGTVRCGFLGPFLNCLFWLRLLDNFHRVRPDAKVIITLRDPVERAYSHWKWEVLFGGKAAATIPHFRTFANYVALALELFPHTMMDTYLDEVPFLQSGIYHKAVETWISRFGEANVLVVNIDKYFAGRQEVLQRVQSFLELPLTDLPEYRGKVNENPLKLAPPDEASRKLLASFYRPYNEKLYDLLGQDFGWYAG